MQVLLQERITEYTTTDMCSQDDNIDDTILVVSVTAAGMLLHIPPMQSFFPSLSRDPLYHLLLDSPPPLLRPPLP